MPALPRIAQFADELVAMRRDFHAHPEIGFEEQRTSGIVAEKLASWGIEVHRGIGKTGVVGVLRGRGSGARRVGLRADMDALPMDEETNLPYRSKHPGVFHGCGHDGTVVFIFQPAEEGLGGARAMLADGLFERFRCDEIFALHNAPEGPQGRVAINSGPMMAGADFFDIRITGRGAHGAHPHQAIDPIVVAMTLAQAVQTIVSRNTDPRHATVVSITQFHAGSAYNVIPESARLGGTVRTFQDENRQLVRDRIRALTAGIATSFGATVDVDIRDIFTVLENHEAQTRAIVETARELLGEARVDTEPRPKMASEDFADMLRVVPGAYFWLGQTPGPAVHNPGYLFDDGILPIGASILARIAERRLAAARDA